MSPVNPSECTGYSIISLSWTQVPAHPKELGALREEAAKCNNLVIAQKTRVLRAGIGRGMAKDSSDEPWVQTQLWEKHIIKRQKKLPRELMDLLCSAIAYKQIDVIMVRQHLAEPAVIIRALTGPSTKPHNTAVSSSSLLSSCPTEKRGCAFISLY